MITVIITLVFTLPKFGKNMKKIIFLTLLSLFMPLLLSLAAQAQEDQIFVAPGVAYDNAGHTIRRQLQEQSFHAANKYPVGTVEMSIIHPSYLEADQFALLLKKANSMTDCYEYSPLEYEAKFIEDIYLDINVSFYRRNLKSVKNPAYDCNTTSKVISGMVVFSADDLRQKNVRQIRFNNGNVRDIYDIVITPDSIRLVPQSMVAFQGVGLKGVDKNYLEYKFADAQKIALKVPMAQDGEDVTKAVRDLAYRSALEPIFAENGSSLDEDNIFYFNDPNGGTVGQITDDEPVEFGTITVLRPYDGPEGRVGLPVNLKVFLIRADAS